MSNRIGDDFFDAKSTDRVEEIYKDGHEYEMFADTYFVFIDVLGFKKTIDEHRDAKYREGKDNVEGEYEEKYRDIFCKYFDFVDVLGKEADNKAFYTGQISDSLFFYTFDIGILAQYIEMLLNFLLFAMRENVFVRGGITKGILYVDKGRRNQYYGDCVAYAYLLESSVAKYPRIMVDTDTYKDLCEAYEGVFKEDRKKRERMFIKGSGQGNGRQWLNNFYCFENENIFQKDKQEKKELRDLCLEIGKNIDLNMEKKEFENDTYEKYIMLKREFEETCNKVWGGKNE